MVFAVHLDICRVDARGGHRRGWGDQKVHLLHDLGVLLLDHALDSQRLGIVFPQHVLPGNRAVEDVWAVIFPVVLQHSLVGDYAVGHGRDTHGADVFHHGQADLLKLGAQFLQGGYAAPHRRLDLAVQQVEIMIGGHAHLQPLEALTQEGAVVGHRHRHCARVQRVVSGQDLQHQRAVGHRPGHGADVVAVEAGYHQTALADPPIALFEADHSAESPRQAHRATQVGT